MQRVLLRMVAVVPVLAGIVVLAFWLTRVLPGDPVAVLVVPGMSAAEVAQLRADLGFDRPLGVQFLDYLRALGRGDLGVSRSTGQPVAEDIARRLPASVELAVTGFVLAVVVALPLGVRAAQSPGGAFDRVARGVSSLAGALPTFVTGLLLIHVFYTLAAVAPEPSGRLDPFLVVPPRLTGVVVIDALAAGQGGVAASALAHLVLPALTMALFALSPLVRITRAAMIASLASPSVEAARGLGLAPRRVLWRYGFRQAAGPVVQVAALTLCYMLGANVLVERVFAWPGVGSYALDALVASDFAPVQGVLLVLAAIFVLVTLAADMIHAALDPRGGA